MIEFDPFSARLDLMVHGLGTDDYTAVRLSYGDFGLVFQTFDAAAGDRPWLQICSRCWRSERAIFFIARCGSASASATTTRQVVKRCHRHAGNLQVP